VSATVGVIGLGLTGRAIARNLLAAGYTVVGYDTDAAITRASRADGIASAADAAEVAVRAHDLLLSLPSAAAVLATAQSIIESGVGRSVVIETSTLALADKLRFGEVLTAPGHIALDCSLSGTGAQAVSRDLVILASGAAMALAKRAGLDPQRVVEVIGAGAGSSHSFELRAPMMAEGRYEPPTMRVSTWQKDMEASAAFAVALDFPTPLFSATAPLSQAALVEGRGGQDTAAVRAVLEAMRGTPG